MQGDKIPLLSVRRPPNRPAFVVRARALFERNMHAVYLCHFCPFSPSIDREPQKSFYIFLPLIVSPCSSNLLQSCTWARTLKSLYLLRVPLQSSYALQPLKVSTHHAQPHRVSIWFAHPCSPYAIKSERVSAYLLPP